MNMETIERLTSELQIEKGETAEFDGKQKKPNNGAMSRKKNIRKASIVEYVVFLLLYTFFIKCASTFWKI